MSHTPDLQGAASNMYVHDQTRLHSKGILRLGFFQSFFFRKRSHNLDWNCSMGEQTENGSPAPELFLVPEAAICCCAGGLYSRRAGSPMHLVLADIKQWTGSFELTLWGGIIRMIRLWHSDRVDSMSNLLKSGHFSNNFSYHVFLTKVRLLEGSFRQNPVIVNQALSWPR